VSENSLQPWHILYIEDDEEDQMILRVMVKKFKDHIVQLEWAPSFEIGREMMYAHQYQAILIDYDLGGDKGIDLIREANDQGYDVPIIMLTGYNSHDLDVEALQAGAAHYLAKWENNPALLERTIRYAIERKAIEAGLKSNISSLARELQQRERVDSVLRKQRLGLSEQEFRFTSIFEKTPYAAVLARFADGVVLNVNEAWEQLSGLSREMVIGKTLSESGFVADTCAGNQVMSQPQLFKMHLQSGEERSLSCTIELIDLGSEKVCLHRFEKQAST
jgi:DNA-binding response OmpR family regulator